MPRRAVATAAALACALLRCGLPLASAGRAATAGPEHSAHHHRHATGRRPRRLGERGRLHAVDRSPGGGGHPLLAGARARGGHAAVACVHPVRALPVRPRRPRERRLPLSPPTVDTLATVLKAQGYRTGAFVSAFPLDARFGLGRGFDVYDDQYGKGGDHSAFHVPERRGADTVAAALEWIGTAPPATSGRQAVVCLGPRLRAALPVSAPRAVRHAPPDRTLSG